MDFASVETGHDLAQFIREGVLAIDPTANVVVGPGLDHPDRVIGTIWIEDDVARKQVAQLLSQQYGCLVDPAPNDIYVFFFGSVFDFKDAFDAFQERHRQTR